MKVQVYLLTGIQCFEVKWPCIQSQSVVDHNHVYLGTSCSMFGFACIPEGISTGIALRDFSFSLQAALLETDGNACERAEQRPLLSVN